VEAHNLFCALCSKVLGGMLCSLSSGFNLHFNHQDNLFKDHLKKVTLSHGLFLYTDTRQAVCTA